jgi:hypothetical protein
MKTINRMFKRYPEEVMLQDYSVLIKINIGIFTTILVVCLLHQVNLF